MPFFRHRFSACLVWAICLMVLAVSFAPRVSLKGTTLVEVCTAQGMKYLSVATRDDAGTPAGPQKAHHLSAHCPWCSAHTAALGMPPAPWSVTRVALPGHALPPLFLKAPRPLFAWAAAHPRAPPSV